MTIDQALKIAMQHHENGRFTEAEAIYRQVLAQKPDYHDANQLFGTLAYQTGRFEVAVAHISRAIAAKGDVAHYHNNLGSALVELGRTDEAIAAYRRAVELNSELADAHRNLADALSECGRFEEAIPHYERGRALRPNWPDLLNNFGHALQALGRSAAAAERYRDALSFDPGFAAGHANLGTALLETGQIDAALHSFRAAVRLAPEQAALHSNLLYAMHFDPAVDARSIFDEHVKWAGGFAEALSREAAGHLNDRVVNRRLRIGYVSADLREHPVGRFMLPVLEHRDRNRFEVHVFSDVHVADKITERAKELVVFWNDTRRLADEDLANLIREKQIDLLVDLAGHSAQNRLLAFARKPAPVQATYLGYPNTTGMSAIDWRITDAIADPPRAEGQHVEKLIRMADGFLAYRPPENLPALGARPEGVVTFGSFNNFAKISSATLAIWRNLLDAVTNSRLVLKSQAIADDASRAQFLQRLGLPVERVEVLLKSTTQREHLAAYANVDVALDTFPYNGTTTTCEALAMGVAVVTLAGETHASRVGASILTHGGFREWIANTPADYVRIAAALTKDSRPSREDVRSKFLASKVCDTKAFVGRLESAYREMWSSWAAR